MSAPIESSPQRPLPTIARTPAIFGGFTPRQSAFIDNYTGRSGDSSLTGNGVKSAKAAGYTGEYHTLGVTARQLLKQPKIIAEMRRRLGIAVASPGEVLELLTKHARADATDIVNANGELDLRKARRKRITKKIRTKRTIRYTKDGEKIEEITTEAEIHDPQSALEKLGRFHQLFPTRIEITANDLDAAINEAVERYNLPVIDVTATVIEEIPTTTTESATYAESDPSHHNGYYRTRNQE